MRGSPTAMPADWIPVKTQHGWTAVQLREEHGVPKGFAVLADPLDRQIRFWRRRFQMVNEMAGWAMQQELEELRAKVRQYESAHTAHRPARDSIA